MYHQNEIVEATVLRVEKNFILVQLDETTKGVVHLKEISDYYVADIAYFFRPRQKVELLVLNVFAKTNLVELSYKQIMPSLLRNPFTYELKPTKNGYNNLKQAYEASLNKEK